MFKGKKSLYILLPLNIFIWAFIGYKIYASLQDEDVTLSEAKSPPVKLDHSDSASYSLQLNYADPFLKQEPARKSKPSAAAPVKASSPVLVTEKKTAPSPAPTLDIKYMGLVQNKTSGATTAMVSINGKSYLVKAGEVVEQVAFTSINSDAMTVKVGKNKLTIIK